MSDPSRAPEGAVDVSRAVGGAVDLEVVGNPAPVGQVPPAMANAASPTRALDACAEPTVTPELVAAARHGDRDAFDALVRATYVDTYTLAHRLTGDVDTARDVVQEAYLRAYRGIGRFRGDAQFSTWLYRITANCASTQLGRGRRHRHEELTDDLPVRDQRPVADPHGRAEQAELRGLVREALESLPPRLRAVVVLRDVYDLSHEAIAAELGITVSAAKVRLHRARRRLRDDLGPGGRGADGGAAARAV
jgi:RNA polymerase sigma-70 factor (ECF subfamily)